MEKSEVKNNVLVVFGQNIRKNREKRNLDIAELAISIGYDRNCLSKLEYGEQNISYETAVNLARELNTSFPALFSRNYTLTEEFCEDDFLFVFIENIKRELMAKRKSQVHIYIESGIQESVVSRILRGKTKNPTLKTLYRIGLTVADGDMTRLFSRNTKI